MAVTRIFIWSFITTFIVFFLFLSLNLISTQVLAQSTDEKMDWRGIAEIDRINSFLSNIQQRQESRKIFTTRPVPVRFVSNTSDPYTFETVNKLNAYVQNSESAWAKGAGGATEYIKVSVRMSSHKKGFVYETIELKLVWEYETPSFYPRQKTIERMNFEIKKYPLMDDSAVKEITEVTDIIIQKILNDG